MLLGTLSAMAICRTLRPSACIATALATSSRPSGETPTGSAPTIYLSVRPGQSASAFAQNRGSGGGFALKGALATSVTSPND